MATFFGHIFQWIAKLFKDANEEAAKAAVLIVETIKPILFSGTATTIADILDALTHTDLPTEIVADLQKWLPIFVATQSIVSTLNENSTEAEVEAALNSIVAEFPNWSWLQQTKYLNDLAAQIYVVAENLAKGEKVPWAEIATIIQSAFVDLQHQGLIK